MPYQINHVLANTAPTLKKQSVGDEKVIVRCQGAGRLRIRYPGALQVKAQAVYLTRVWIEAEVDPGARASTKGKWQTQRHLLDLVVRISTPDGLPFTAGEVTLSDLARFRDLRGVSQGEWSYTVEGQSLPVEDSAGVHEVVLSDRSLRITVTETVTSKSAPPLVNAQVVGDSVQTFSFDLYSLGQFRARVSPSLLFPPRQWRGKLRLKDPNGRVVASSNGPELDYAVTPATLNLSRGPQGQVLPWTLEAQGTATGGATHRIQVRVIGQTRVRLGVLQGRIDKLLGPSGSNLQLDIENRNGELCGRVKILDELSAETIDMHGLLDDLIRANSQDSGVDRDHPDVRVNQSYTLFGVSARPGYGLRVVSNGFKIRSLGVTAGATKHLQPALPGLRVSVQSSGNLVVRIGGFSLATLKLAGNLFELEVGLQLDARGVVVPKVWMPEKLIDIDLHWQAALAASALSASLLLLGSSGVVSLIEREVNNGIRSAVEHAIVNMGARLPHILAMIHGDDLTYTALRLEGNDAVFDFLAPLEHDTRPSPLYRGAVGRSATQLGPDSWTFTPRQVGNTWAAENLAKINHIVVVMMENRSHDHVLGYRAQSANGGDGLSTELLNALGAMGFDLPRLGKSNLQVKTQFPISVGHELADVAEQLALRLTLPDGRGVNSPAGFLSNFSERYQGQSQEVRDRVKLNDVLGWYDGADLPFYRYLSEQYGFCDRYFCSHAGPTLPNRMFSLTGDVQYDRAGEAIVDNNNGDNFYLSRANTIYDIFNRRGLDWRVYESFPSVTMLRMFARYATDDTHIVPIDRLAQDVAAGNLPPLVVVEPAMHHFPQSDDHPVADMRNGQAFLHGVYNTLRSNPAVWRKTLLIITYDEHGGFYDHVVPPLADLRDARQLGGIDPGGVFGAGNGGVVVGGAGVAQPTRRDAALAENLARGLSPALLAGLPAFSSKGDPATKDCLTPYGVRVPTFVVSPWVPPGLGPSVVLDHCSILKTIMARFIGPQAPFLSDRVSASRSFNAFLSLSSPRMDVPPIAAPRSYQLGMKVKGQAIATRPLSRAQMRKGNVDYHDLTGRLARMLGR